MQSVRLPFSAALLAAAVAALAPGLAAQYQPVQADQGRVVLHFLDQALEQSGLELLDLQTTAEVADPFTEGMEGDLLGFRIADAADLTVLQADDGTFVPYGVIGGSVSVDGGFILSSPSTGRAVDFTGFSLHPVEVRNDGPGGESDPQYFYISVAGDPSSRDFVLCYVKILFAADEAYDPGPGPGDHEQPPKLRIKAWDLIVTPTLADKLQRPDLIGRVLAYGKLDATIVPHEGDWELPDGQNINTPYGGGGGDPSVAGSIIDVRLGLLTTIKQMGHVGTFPNGREGMSMSTTSCNVGDVNVPWLAAMKENHPGIAMQLYRQMDGRFEQVGISWIKHGFFALSNSQCTPCQNPSNGTFLGVGCSDTYGTSNNADRFWLGPRDEWNPHAGTWSCMGSFFDGTPVDCVRDENGSGNGPVNHRLEAFDFDLGLQNATYYYEAFYMINGDNLRDNNIGSRECTMSWTGSAWSFFTPGSGAGNVLVNGPTIERWADADLSNRGDFGADDGTAILSVNTTDLGGGQWRYEYALFNWTVDRRLRQFSVPVSGSSSDFYFHDIDDQPSNDWSVSKLGKNVTFTFPDVFLSGHKVGGPMDLCTLYNFGFTSNRAPAMHDAALRVQDAGPGPALLAIETLAPAQVTLSASNLGPAEGETINLEVRGGSFGAMIGVLSVNGLPLAEPLILTGSPVPFVGGLASVPLFIPAGVSGLEFDLVAADFDTSVVKLSNLSTLAIQ